MGMTGVVTSDRGRRRTGLAAGGLFATCLLATCVLQACGGGAGPADEGASDTPGSAPGPVPSGSGPSSSPATDGTVSPPGAGAADTRPGSIGERVVVLAEEFMLADVLALGIDPIASTAAVPEVGFQGLEGVDTSGIEVLPMTSLSLEHLASLRPDTIITLQFWIDQVGAATLHAMADVIAVPDGLTIPERLRFLGEELDRGSEAEAVIAELDAATRDAAAAVPDDCRVSLAAIYPGPSPAAFVAGPWELPTSILSTGCALDPDASVATPDENGRVYLSLEQLAMLDAPRLVLLQSETVDGEQAAVEQLTADPLWAQLPAVKTGDVTVFDRLGYPGADGQIRFLRDFAAVFEQ